MAVNIVASPSTSPHDASGAINPKPSIILLPASPQAFSAIATADLLAFSGVSGEPASRLINPLRRDLVRCGAHPRHWPDFNSSVDSLWKGVREGKIMIMAIVEDPDAALLVEGSTKFSGRGEQSKGLVSIGGVKGVVAGFAKLRPPAQVRQKLIVRRTAANRIWGEYVAPVAKKIREKVVGGDATGVDTAFLGLFKGEMERVRLQNLTGFDWLFELLLVHPAYQGLGIGRALIEHAQTLAESADPLVFPYPKTYTPKVVATSIIQPPPAPKISKYASPTTTNDPLDEDAGSDSQETKAASNLKSRKVRIFLEASNAGAPVYARLGFRTVSRSTIEYKEEQVSWPFMLWEGNSTG